jgi:glycosyltransferase involved in cell wall biosynthesis
MAERGKPEQAWPLYEQLEQIVSEPKLKALVHNDLATLQVLRGDMEAASERFQAALALDAACESARENLDLLLTHMASSQSTPAGNGESVAAESNTEPATSIRVAILSFLFNWPSTGGGNVHTYDLARFLGKFGYEVRHIYPRYSPWEIGVVQGKLPYASEALDFHESQWNTESIQARFRRAVDEYDPDFVVITDSWNIKPHLAEAVRGYPYILRFQAMELLCPLNNVRLLPEKEGRVRQCALHQLAIREECAKCLGERGHLSGSLHQAERGLSGVGNEGYHDLLLRALEEARVVLVVNPLHEAMLAPYCHHVIVVTSGMDAARFAIAPGTTEATQPKKSTLLFAGLVQEMFKGFDILHDACSRLWVHRQDFELVATSDPPGRIDAFTRLIGWQSQEELPVHLRAADVVVVPTMAQDALGRTAVEAMAAGRPVIASRIGGLPFTVADGATGLLFKPGDAEDLAKKIAILLDDRALRERLGAAGRRRFEDHYDWDVIIQKHYRPILSHQRTVASAM